MRGFGEGLGRSVRGWGVAPDFDVAGEAVAGPEGDGAGAAEEVLPELGVGEGLLVGAEELEDRAGGDEDYLALGPAHGIGRAEWIEPRLTGGEQILAVARGGGAENDSPIATLEALDGVDRGEGHGATHRIDQ